MNRLPLGASFEDAFHALQPQQPQQPTRAQNPPAQIRPIAASYEPSLPNGSEMPDEWGYPPPGLPQFSNIPKNVQGAVAHPTGSGSVPRGTPQSHPTPATATVTAPPTVPTCRYPNCRRRVERDERTQELTEYCSLDHMRDAVQHLGFPLCPACKRCPRRSDSKFCGSLCEQWAVQRQRQLQQLQQQQQQQQQQQLQSAQGLQQQQHQQQQQQQQRQQHWPPSANMGPPSTVPNSSAVTWSNAARRSSYSGNSGTRDGSGWQGRYQQ